MSVEVAVKGPLKVFFIKAMRTLPKNKVKINFFRILETNQWIATMWWVFILEKQLTAGKNSELCDFFNPYYYQYLLPTSMGSLKINDLAGTGRERKRWEFIQSHVPRLLLLFDLSGSSSEYPTCKTSLYLTYSELSQYEQPFLGSVYQNIQQKLLNIAAVWGGKSSWNKQNDKNLKRKSLEIWWT